MEITTVGHRTFDDQLACLSDQNMFASDIKDWSKDIGRCISHCLYMSLLLPGIMSDQNTTMLAQPPHLSDICQITHQQL